MRLLARLVAALFLAAVTAILAAQTTNAQQRAGALASPRIEISFAKEARGEAVTGKVYVAIGRDNQRSPIEQASPTGAPLFSRYVDALAPGAIVAIAAERVRLSGAREVRPEVRRASPAGREQSDSAHPRARGHRDGETDQDPE